MQEKQEKGWAYCCPPELTEAEALIIWLNGYFSAKPECDSLNKPLEHIDLIRNATIRIFNKHNIKIFDDPVMEK